MSEEAKFDGWYSRYPEECNFVQSVARFGLCVFQHPEDPIEIGIIGYILTDADISFRTGDGNPWASSQFMPILENWEDTRDSIQQELLEHATYWYGKSNNDSDSQFDHARSLESAAQSVAECDKPIGVVTQFQNVTITPVECPKAWETLRLCTTNPAFLACSSNMPTVLERLAVERQLIKSTVKPIETQELPEAAIILLGTKDKKTESFGVCRFFMKDKRKDWQQTLCERIETASIVYSNRLSSKEQRDKLHALYTTAMTRIQTLGDIRVRRLTVDPDMETGYSLAVYFQYPHEQHTRKLYMDVSMDIEPWKLPEHAQPGENGKRYLHFYVETDHRPMPAALCIDEATDFKWDDVLLTALRDRRDVLDNHLRHRPLLREQFILDARTDKPCDVLAIDKLMTCLKRWVEIQPTCEGVCGRIRAIVKDERNHPCGVVTVMFRTYWYDKTVQIPERCASAGSVIYSVGNAANNDDTNAAEPTHVTDMANTFRMTSETIVEYVKEHPDMSMQQIVEALKQHCFITSPYVETAIRRLHEDGKLPFWKNPPSKDSK